jgi:hypothetical protein
VHQQSSDQNIGANDMADHADTFTKDITAQKYSTEKINIFFLLYRGSNPGTLASMSDAFSTKP